MLDSVSWPSLRRLRPSVSQAVVLRSKEDQDLIWEISWFFFVFFVHLEILWLMWDPIIARVVNLRVVNSISVILKVVTI